MRTNRERYEPRSGECLEQSEAKILEALQEAYDQGFEEGIEEAKKQFMETQLLIFHTGGSA
jgi:flagellar biosynthesis/type III secretory pathway protein FliH